MSEAKTTSTFTIHHDRCDPSKWTVADWKALADYVRTGSLSHAAHLSRIGMQLALDGRHEAVGGTVEHMGWLLAGPSGEPFLDAPAATIDDLGVDDFAVCDVVAIYRGPVQYAVRYGIGDDDGNCEGYEVDVFDEPAKAEAFLKSLMPEAA